MKVIETPHTNVNIAESQDQYQTMPSTRLEDGRVITCWELSEADMREIKDTGRIYLHQHTFNNPVQPVMMTTEDILERYYPYKQKFTETSLAVCIACLLREKATKELWHLQDGFFLNPDNIDALGEWYSQMGKIIELIEPDQMRAEGEIYIAGGEDPRNPGFIHFCLLEGDQVVHDPHPSDEGLKNVKAIYKLSNF